MNLTKLNIISATKAQERVRLGAQVCINSQIRMLDGKIPSYHDIRVFM